MYKKLILSSLAIVSLFPLSNVVNAEEYSNQFTNNTSDSSSKVQTNNGDRVLSFYYKRTVVSSVDKLVYIRDVTTPRKGSSTIKVEDGKTYTGDGVYNIFGFTVGVNGSYHVSGSSSFKVSSSRIAAVGLYRKYNFKKVKVQMYESGKLVKTSYEVKKTALGPAYLAVKYY